MLFHQEPERKVKTSNPIFLYEPSLIEAMVNQGMTQAEIGKVAHTSTSTVWKFCAAHDIKPLTKRNRDPELIQRMVDERKTQQQISLVLGCSCVTIKRFMKLFGIQPSYAKPSRFKALNDTHLLRIQSLISEGKLEREIAIILTMEGTKCSQRDISQLLCKHSVSPTNGRGRTRRVNKNKPEAIAD